MDGQLRKRDVGRGVSKIIPDSDAQEKTTREPSQCKYIGKLLIVCGALASYLFYAYITSPLSSVRISCGHDPGSLQWAQARNSDLQQGQRVLEELEGPESIAIDDDGNWYTGLEDGRIVKIVDAGKNSQVVSNLTAKFPYIAEGGNRTNRRPLGLRLQENRLYVADAYQGIYMLNLLSQTWEKIVGYNDVYPSMAFPDDLTITSDGQTLYFTDVSSKWQYDNVAFIHAEGKCNGRVFKVDLKTKHVVTLRDEMCFPNSIQLNKEENVLLVSEQTRIRISVLDSQFGATLKYIPLPGGADNIRSSKSGGYWIGLPAFYSRYLALTYNYPFVRDILASVLGPKGLYVLANFRKGIVVKLDESLEPTYIHLDLEGKVARGITEVYELDDGYLLGSFIAHGLVKLKNLA